LSGPKKEAIRIKIEADLAKARKWAAHFDEKGQSNTVHHQNAERLERELDRLDKPSPKKSKPKEEKEDKE
jgi:hypothetical protein